MKIIFKNLEKSELAREVVAERLAMVFLRFPELPPEKTSITLSMENSPVKAGPDLFTVKFLCMGGKYKGVIMNKSAPTLYQALADLVDHLLERLNRFGDKKRIKNLKTKRAAFSGYAKPMDDF
jgi:ribosome-associated translation inhibitor RaiA